MSMLRELLGTGSDEHMADDDNNSVARAQQQAEEFIQREYSSIQSPFQARDAWGPRQIEPPVSMSTSSEEPIIRSVVPSAPPPLFSSSTQVGPSQKGKQPMFHRRTPAPDSSATIKLLKQLEEEKEAAFIRKILACVVCTPCTQRQFAKLRVM